MALKEALCSVYWYKSELRGFLQLCLSNPGILNNFNWDNYKRQIASDVIDYLVANPASHLSDLTKICYELCKLDDFLHLKPLDDGPQKVDRARNAVSQLRQLVEPHQDVKKEQDDIKRRQELAAKKLRENAAVRQKLESIKGRYMALVGSNNSTRLCAAKARRSLSSPPPGRVAAQQKRHPCKARNQTDVLHPGLWASGRPAMSDARVPAG